MAGVLSILFYYKKIYVIALLSGSVIYFSKLLLYMFILIIMVGLIKVTIERLVSIYSNFHEAVKLNHYHESLGMWEI